MGSKLKSGKYTGSYRGVKTVLLYNDRDFITAFMGVRTIMCFVKTTGAFIEVKRKDVWNISKTREMVYYLTKEIFVNNRSVMVIV